ncbi:TolC family protein [Clostridium butyricum]|uniref:TolC family protein n=1 Tax=Clostridium butyricum TaxID=1492 RepID=UPI000F537149|nr:TolC family protein [Clostridium butyricum]RQN12010.1 TolC family protein [Clostridium butyricum]
MRKNLNKIVAFAIGVSVISGSIVPAMAADIINTDTIVNTQTQASTEKKVLTVDDAVKAAIANSDTLKLLDKSINYTEKMNNLSKDLDDTNNTLKDDDKDYTEDKRDFELKSLKQKRKFNEDVLSNTVNDLYNSIVTKQIDIENLQKKLELLNKNFNDIKLKNELGLATSIDAQDFQLNVKQLEDALKTSQDQLKVFQYNLKNYIGLDVSSYTLNKDIDYDVLEIDGSVDSYLDEIVEDYIKLTYKEDIIELNKDYYDDNKVSDPGSFTQKEPVKDDYYDETTNSYPGYDNALNSYKKNLENYKVNLQLRLQYLGNKLSNYTDETTLSETKKQFKQTLRNYYMLLEKTKSDIDRKQQEILINNTKLRNMKIKYDLGMITKNEYDSRVLDNQGLALDLRNSILDYNDYKNKIEKPWITLTL